MKRNGLLPVVVCALVTLSRAAAAQSAPPPAPVLPGSAVPPGAFAPPYVAPTLPVPLLDFESDRGTLEYRVYQEDQDNDVGWRRVCGTACRIPAYAAFEYRLTGDGLLDSPPFRVRPQPGTVRVRIDTRTKAQRIAGVVMIPVGAAVGAVAFLVAAFSCFDSQGSCSDDNQRRGRFALAVSVGGLAVAVTGLVLAIDARTRLDAKDGQLVSQRLRLPLGLALTPRGIAF